ncbi:MAG TPA: hypothetical protein VHF25_01855 [Nitriliruptorales bacterium]|nr:hypothetical protein [Nitriliruptorales bacterium]
MVDDTDLARRRRRSDPRSLVHGSSSHVVAHHLDLASVQPHPELEPKPCRSVLFRDPGADRPHRPVEDRQEPVARRGDLPPPETVEDESHVPVVPPEQFTPR